MIGLSLSFCIKDIIEGRVDLDKVEKISTGTAFRTRALFHMGMMLDYCRIYWRHDPERAHKIAMDLWDAGKIDQPRCRGEEPLPIHDGHWL